jgi:signal transduction histidine kinase
VFRKFYRVQNKETQNLEGAGLGLYITREIVKNHKGKIKVFSEGVGKGSTFTVSLPMNGAQRESKSGD